jgi:hypothetical protein
VKEDVGYVRFADNPPTWFAFLTQACSARRGWARERADKK